MDNFDQDSADRICNFFRKYLILPETGKPFILADWQREMLGHVFGHKNDDGTRLVRTLYLEVPKKNGKSALASGLALYMLCADDEMSAEVYSVAADKSQASIVFDAAKKMVESSPKLSKIVKPYRFSLIHERSGSKYAVLSADVKSKEGIKASCILFDELHAQPDRKMWDTLRGASLSRRQPLTVVTTTAGDNKQTIGWEIHEYATRLKEGKRKDPTFYPVIYGAEESDNPDEEATWKKCNPNLGVTFEMENFRGIYSEAKAAGPARFSSWKRYHLNVWTSSLTAWLPMTSWNECGEENVDAQTLTGRTSFPGLDVSSTTDLTALVLMFPAENDSYDLLAWHWLPRGRVSEAELRDRVPYRQWATEGYLELTEGNAIDQRYIFKRIKEIDALYPFHSRNLRLDDYNAWQLITDMQAEGMIPVPISMKAKGLSAPSKELLRLVVEKKLNHGDNPLLTWQASQVEIVEDVDGNIRPVKGKGEARKRIDGIVSTVLALSGAMIHKQEPSKLLDSVYSHRGLFVI